jgi:site-specific recombinase XerC
MTDQEIERMDRKILSDVAAQSSRFDNFCNRSAGTAGTIEHPTGEAQDLSRGIALHPDFLQTQPGLHDESHQRQETESHNISITLAEFVKRKFVPECVIPRRLAGRSHFHFILRHVLTPEEVARAFGISAPKKASSLRSIPDWPYLGSWPLHHIDQNAIKSLTSTALRAGYSTQTAIHIRNVIRSIFVHAIKTKCFEGDNPASLVPLVAVERRISRSLTVIELRRAMQIMCYPEKPIALFAVLTDMNLSEICGLQWRYVNLTNYPRQLESELLPARTIAVRNQSYRGEFSPVSEGRQRSFPISAMLFSVLSDLKNRTKFSNSQDFVFASRRGSPIYPENVGTRRLKAVGRLLEMPWLSWSAFHRTRLEMKSQFGAHLNRELEQILPIHEATIGNLRQGKVPSP